VAPARGRGGAPVTRSLPALAAAAVLGVAAPAYGAPAPSARPVAVTVQAEPGHAGDAARSLGRAALRVTRRRGDTLQVVAAPAHLGRLRALPGVAAATPAPTAFGDQEPPVASPGPAVAAPGPVLSQGLQRTGARALAPGAADGRGLVIAVLDLGFGGSLESLRARGELPPASRTEERSFDTVNGLAGRNAYGNPTNHGELVAQTLHDYAPAAQYVFVNYRTPEDFVAAVDWLVTRRPDVVVHSNSFIEGPFDGTSAPAAAVDRAAAAGILWFNSAGNYAQGHWSGPWADADGDRALDFGGPGGGILYGAANRPLTFALSWPRAAGATRTDLDLVLERRADDGSWSEVAASRDRQSAGAAPAERVVGHLPTSEGFFRVRVQHVSGPPPAGALTVFSREVDMSLFGGGPAGSVPTPGDAAGSVTVGAADWRGDRLEAYSSQGPTDDGRLKPDLVAPTDTVLAGPSGPRLVGGTSNAAPNAAGAAALLIASLRARGLPSAPADVRAQLAAWAVDLGPPGPDPAYGAGRVRVELDPPALTAASPPAGRVVRGVVPVSVQLADPSSVARLALSAGGRTLARVTTRDRAAGRLDTRTLPDGRHPVVVEAADWPGNPMRIEWWVRVDNTRPVARVVQLGLARAPRPAARRRPRPRVRPLPPRPATLRVRLSDAGGGTLRLQVRLNGGRARTLRVPARAGVRRVPLGRLRPGRARVEVRVSDAAGNVRVLRTTRVLR